MYSLLVRGGVVVCILAALVDVTALTGGSRDAAHSLSARQNHERNQASSKTKFTLSSSLAKRDHEVYRKPGRDRITTKATKPHESYHKNDHDLKNLISRPSTLGHSYKRGLQLRNRENECVFPFIYDGETTYECVKDASTGNKRWCSLTNNYDRDTLWTHCSQQDNATKRISTPHSKILPRNRAGRAKYLSHFARALSRSVSAKAAAAEAKRKALQHGKSSIRLPNTVYIPGGKKFNTFKYLKKSRPNVPKLLIKNKPGFLEVTTRKIKPSTNGMISNSRTNTFTNMLNKMNKMSHESLIKISSVEPFGGEIETPGHGKSLSDGSSLLSKPMTSLKKVGDLTNRLVQSVKGLTASVPLKTGFRGAKVVAFQKLDTGRKPYTILHVGNGHIESPTPPGVMTQTQKPKQRIISDAKNVNIIIINNDKSGHIDLNDIEKSIAESTGVENEPATEGKDHLGADQNTMTAGKDNPSVDERLKTDDKDIMDKGTRIDGKDPLGTAPQPQTEEKEGLSTDQNLLTEGKDPSMDERLKTDENDIMDKGPRAEGKYPVGTAEQLQTEGKEALSTDQNPMTEGKDTPTWDERLKTDEKDIRIKGPTNEGNYPVGTAEQPQTEGKGVLSADQNLVTEGKDNLSMDERLKTDEKDIMDKGPRIEGKDPIGTVKQPQTEGKGVLSIDQSLMTEGKDNLSIGERLKTDEKDIMDKGPNFEGEDPVGTVENPQTEGKEVLSTEKNPIAEEKDTQSTDNKLSPGENNLQGTDKKPIIEGKALFATEDKLTAKEKNSLNTNENPKIEGKDPLSIEGKLIRNETEVTERKPIVEGKEVTDEMQMITNEKSIGSKTDVQSTTSKPFPLHVPNDKNNMDSSIGSTITYHGDKELMESLNSLEKPTQDSNEVSSSTFTEAKEQPARDESDKTNDMDIHMLHAVSEGAKENDNNVENSLFGKERYTTFGATLPQKPAPSEFKAQTIQLQLPVTVLWSDDKMKNKFDVDFSNMAFAQKGVSRNRTISSSKGNNQGKGNRNNNKVHVVDSGSEGGNSSENNHESNKNSNNIMENSTNQYKNQSLASGQQVDLTNEAMLAAGGVSTDPQNNTISSANKIVVDPAVPSVESAVNDTSRQNTSVPTEDSSEMVPPIDWNTITSPPTYDNSQITSAATTGQGVVNSQSSDAMKLSGKDTSAMQSDTGDVTIPHYVSSSNYTKDVGNYATNGPGKMKADTDTELDSGKNVNENGLSDNSPPLMVLNGGDGTEQPSVADYEELSARGAHSALNKSISEILNSTNTLSNISVSLDDNEDKVKIETIEKEDGKKEKENVSGNEKKQGSDATKEKEVSGNNEQKPSLIDATEEKETASVNKKQPSESAKVTNNDNQKPMNSAQDIITSDATKANNGNFDQKAVDSVPGNPISDLTKANGAATNNNYDKVDNSTPSVSAKHTSKISFTPYNDLELNDDDDNEMNPVNSKSSDTGTSLVDETGLPLDNENPTTADETTSPASTCQSKCPVVDIGNSDQSKIVTRNDTNGQIGKAENVFQGTKPPTFSAKSNDSSSSSNTTLPPKESRKEQDYGDTNIAKVLSDISSTLTQSSKDQAWDNSAGTANDNQSINVVSDAAANAVADKESIPNANKNATTTNTIGISDTGENPAFMKLDDGTSEQPVATDKDFTELSPTLLKPGSPPTHMNGQVNMSYAPEGLVVSTWGGNGNGAKCNFPFIYNGETYFNCITLNRDKPWCSTTASYDRTPIWGYCDQESSMLAVRDKPSKKNETSKVMPQVNSGVIVKDSEDLGSINTFGGNGLGRPCVLPFIYDGEVHAQCIPRSEGLSWCAVTHSYDVAPMWGNCCDGEEYKC